MFASVTARKPAWLKPNAEPMWLPRDLNSVRESARTCVGDVDLVIVPTARLQFAAVGGDIPLVWIVDGDRPILHSGQRIRGVRVLVCMFSTQSSARS